MDILRQDKIGENHDPSHLPSTRVDGGGSTRSANRIRGSKVIRDVIKVPGTGGVLVLLFRSDNASTPYVNRCGGG